MNTILEKFLDLKAIIDSFNGLQKKYNWLLTDLYWFYTENCLHYFEDYRRDDNGDECLNNYWITGENLTELANNKDVYFIWGVFSAFDKQETIDLDDIKEEPYANGNPNFGFKILKSNIPRSSLN